MKHNSPQFLLEIQLLRDKVKDFSCFPYSLPIINNLQKIKLHPSVTFIVGENGTGKSTLLEAIAISLGFNAEGGTINFNFSTCPSHTDLYNYIRIVRSHRRPQNGFFLRAESFYNVASNIDELDREPAFSPPIRNSYGGKSLHQQSHGEAFFSLFNNKFSENGLYILDEPEAALSPMRQMAILSRMHNLINQGSQFIIATHSPIIMAYQDAKILEIHEGVLKEVSYKESSHYTITKGFLDRPEKHLSILLEET